MSEARMDVWTTIADVPHPVKVKCETFGWPNFDENGERMYDNSHWRSEAEAWAYLIRNLNAFVQLSGRRVQECKDRLSDAYREAGDAAALYSAASENYEDWKRSQEQGHG